MPDDFSSSSAATAAPVSDDVFAHALSLHKDGNLAEARQLYDSLLSMDPRHAPARHMRGMLAFQQNDATTALAYIERALASGYSDRNIDNHHGAILLALGQFDAAVAAFRRALKLTPDDVEVLYNLGLAQRRAGRLEDAVASLRTALASWTGANRGDVVLALVAALQQLGLRHQQHARHDDALLLFSEALSLHPGDAGAYNNMGVSLLRLGRGDNALAAWQQALVADPLHGEGLQNLCDLLVARGATDEAAALCRSLIALHPDMAKACHLCGQQLARLSDGEDFLEEAAEALSGALQRDATLADAWMELGRVRQRQHRYNDAAKAFERVLFLTPQRNAARVALGLAQLQGGQPQAALTTLRAALMADPADREAMAYLITAGHAANDTALARDLAENTIAVRALAAPAGYAGLDDFNDALANALRGLDRQHAPPRQSIRGGTQTKAELFTQDNKVIQDFCAALRDEIAAYLAERTAMHSHKKGHPFFDVVPDPLQYRSWSVILRKQGHHVPHIHPEGCISGVYYVTVPQLAGDEGNLELGRAGLELPDGTALAPVQQVQPVRGRLVLFPSYMWHGTVPFSGEGERITIAFDILKPTI